MDAMQASSNKNTITAALENSHYKEAQLSANCFVMLDWFPLATHVAVPTETENVFLG